MGKSERLTRPTRAQKAVIHSKRLKAENWLIAGQTATQLMLQHKETASKKIINL